MAKRYFNHSKNYNTMNNKISVLIPAYNTGKYISECIESVLAQTYRNLEIIIVDDGSSDDTFNIARRYELKDDRIRIFSITHGGVSYARNFCLSQATGEYILFVDSDDWIGECLCSDLFTLAIENNADIVFAAMTMVSEHGRSTLFGDRLALFKETDVMSGQDFFIKMVETGATYPMVAGNLYKRSLIIDNNLSFFGQYHEDEYFMPISLKCAESVMFLRESKYYYRYRRGSIMHNDSNVKERSYVLGNIANLIVDRALSSNQDPTFHRALYKHAGDLRQRSRKLYESYLRHSDKPLLIICLEKGISSQYGIGTYVRLISDVVSDCPWDVIQVEVNAFDKNDSDFLIKHNIPCYSFPRFENGGKAFSQKRHESYCTGVFYYMATHIGSGKKIVCHFNIFSYEYLALLFKEQLNAKVIFTVHYTDWGFRLHGNQEEMIRILNSPSNSYEVSLRDTFNKERDFLANCCIRIIAISEYSYSYLHQLYGLQKDKLILIHNCVQMPKPISVPVSTLRKKYGFKDNDTIILYVGRVDESKGVLELIKAFRTVSAKRPNAHMLIVGDGAFSMALREISPNWEQVCFTGFVGKDTLSELYAIADIGVVPSFHEEFGYVAVEMASAELPVLVNPVGGLKYIAEEIDGVSTIDDNTDRTLSERIADGIFSAMSKTLNRISGIPRKYLFEEFNSQMKSLYDEFFKGRC